MKNMKKSNDINVPLDIRQLFTREIALIGESNFLKLQNSSVLIVGLGGVGGGVCEAIARAGVGTIGIVDFDVVDASNINRQIIALDSTVGCKKVDVMANRIHNIHKKANIIKYNITLTRDNISELFDIHYDYVVDAIDDVNAKIALIQYASEHKIPIISSMGTGGKLNVFDFKIDKIKNTKGCPLARVMRKKLKELGLLDVKVLYSEEKPKSSGKAIGSISFVPPVCGMMLAGEVIKSLIGYGEK